MRVQLPARLWWSHNTYHHRWLRRVPERVGTALDVGCGTGRLACTLARRSDRVDAVDVSAVMIAAARARCPDAEHVRWFVGDVLDRDLPLAGGGYDVVTAVSSLHHLPLDAGLERLAGLVRPGGVLLANAVVGAVLVLTGRGGGPDDEGMPVCPPGSTLAEVRRAAAVLLGARISRGLFWRHLLVWRPPPGR